jgi:hypothetical protein
MSSRTTDDYERMAAAGVRALVEPAFWLGQPRTSIGSFTDYFDSLIGWEPFRASQFGIRHHCTIALNPKEANDPRCREVLEVLPRYLDKDGVVAVGEVGYDWGRSDPLLTKATGEAMLAGGFVADDVDRLLWRNPVEFYAQAGRLDLSDVGGGGSGSGVCFAGNSIQRGGG